MIPHKAQPRQSLLDAAIAATGSIEAAYDIALANGLPLTKVFLSPQEILVPAVRGSVRLLQQPPCTGIDPDTPEPEPDEPEPEPGDEPEPTAVPLAALVNGTPSTLTALIGGSLTTLTI